ncbi:MAG: hypothetical protein HGA67_01380 [Candidatus Yonathbacteria bacterium]|nr:hypothetical protein [Candidatus Yonathbacteria bacterium]
MFRELMGRHDAYETALGHVVARRIDSETKQEYEEAIRCSSEIPRLAHDFG